MTAKPPIRWFQFSLRTLSLGVLALSVGMGWYVSRARQQEALYREFYRSNSSAYFDYQIVDGEYDPARRSWAPAWLHESLGSHFLHSVVKVRLWDDMRGSNLDLRQVDDFCERLDDFPRLRDVRVEFTTDDRLASLGRLRHLQRLELDGSQHLTDRGLAGLSQLSNLRHLDARGVYLPPDAYSAVGQLSCLEVLYLKDGHPTDELLANLVALRRLRELRVECNQCSITDDGLRQLASLRKLEVLEVSGTSISNDGVMQLSRLSRLRRLTLRLHSSYVTNDGVAHLAALSHLESLSLDGIEATDEGLMPLAGLPQLADLRLSGRNLRDASALSQAMPNCTIALRR